MPTYDSTSRTPFAKGGRAGFKSGTTQKELREKKYANAYTKKEYKGGASEKMKSEVKVAAKKKRDRLQARHVSPGGGGKYKYGPHKVDVNRRATEALLGKGKVQEKIIKFGEKFDKKQAEKRKLKKDTKEMKNRAKKLTAYEGTT